MKLEPIKTRTYEAGNKAGGWLDAPGSSASAFITNKILSRVSKMGRVGARLADHAHGCSGCQSDSARLDGKGGGSTI